VEPFSPEQYLDLAPEEQMRQAHALLRDRHEGTLAMATGGCARYAFCVDVPYCLDRRGYPLLHYSSPNPHHHLILTNTTMTLRLPHRVDAEGNEHSILILTGLLTLVDPGDHDSLDRHHRFFEVLMEHYPRGANRLYRLVPDQACFELFSGQRLNLDAPALARRNPLAAREEELLLERINRNIHPEQRIAGVDAYGVDQKKGPGWAFLPFPGPLTERSAVEAAALAMATRAASPIS